MNARRVTHLAISLATLGLLAAVVYRPAADPWLDNHIPEAAPYDVAEGRIFPPPYEDIWETKLNPGGCGTCHPKIFSEWNGSMMANSWRDPAWRAAFLLLARKTALDGNCDVPQPPDGTERALLNPFAEGGCSSKFDLGDGEQTFSRSGSLLDGFCSRCHMPTNYVDNVPPQNVSIERPSGAEHGAWSSHFDPTSDNGTGFAYATAEEHYRNTPTGQRGIFCAVCHTMATSRATPFSNYAMTGEEYAPATADAPRPEAVAAGAVQPPVPAPDSPNLGWGIGAGSYRLSPQAIVRGELFGPLQAAGESPEPDPYLTSTFGVPLEREVGAFTKHPGYAHAKFPRAEMCATCHDVTNPLTLMNELGRWVGGFPIERTYTEWMASRYADRPGNENFDPAFKRDCQTCHMQQDYGQPGTAQTLYRDGKPVPPLRGNPADDAPEREPIFTHHFIGGNAYVTHLIGADVDDTGRVEDWPELSVFSFSSADPESPYHNAYWVGADSTTRTQHARLAWDRLRNVLEIRLRAPAGAAAGERVPLELSVANTGSGHNFPSGFPEGRVAWVAVHAWDVATGTELPIYDAHWDRTSIGVGDLTDRDLPDPNFPDCEHWAFPAGSPDPWAYQLRAMATKGDGCPTLDLVYATPLNLKVDDRGYPIDAAGRVIGRNNPRALPIFEDLDGDGDLFDDAFLMDSRLRPMPLPGATADLSDRYSVVLPEGTIGPVAVVATVYYQSLEAIVAGKFLGNLADTDLDHHLEPCVLGGSCDGRVPTVEPAAVEGAPPVPMEVAGTVIEIAGHPDERRPEVSFVYPAPDAREVYDDVVVKVGFDEPVRGVDETTLTLEGPDGALVPAFVDQIGEGTWGLFPHEIFLEPGGRYTAHLSADVCDAAGHCLAKGMRWSFRVTETEGGGEGSTAWPRGFPGQVVMPDPKPQVVAVAVTDQGEVELRFSEPVMNVTAMTVMVWESSGGDCDRPGSSLAGRLSGEADGTRWIFRPDAGSPNCLSVTDGVYDMAGQRLEGGFRRQLR